MSMAYHHAEWLSLVETSGPFVSLSVLNRVFKQGLDAHDKSVFAQLRLAYEEWRASAGTDDEAALHRAWLRFVLREVLGFLDEVLREGQSLPVGLEHKVPEEHEVLRPDLVVVNHQSMPEPGKARLLLNIYPRTQKLEGAVASSRWKASPATRMMSLLHGTNVRFGLVTNGEQWMVVYAKPGQSTGFASFYTEIFLDEPITLRAFIMLFGVARFFSAEDDTPEALFAQSTSDQLDVTEQLGLQVREAVEIIVREIDRVDRDQRRELLQNFDERRVYEAAVTVMMRLVFLFSAEEKGLLLLGDELYDQFYAVSTLRAQLRETADRFGEEILERRHDAWARLLATFRAVHGGVQHGRMRLRAYGGTLFDPDRFPFLEGRLPGSTWRQEVASPLAINNRTVLHLLEALQMLEVKIGKTVTTQRLSFKGLDIEQIGHVYEGLLDHTAKRATETIMGIQGGAKLEPEIPLAELEAHLVAGPEAFAEALAKRTKRTAKALAKAVTEPDFEPNPRLALVCGQDAELTKRAQVFSRLLRTDSFGYPIVIPKGSIYVTSGSDRRSTGTHYTPRSLTEPIVKHTLDPLVYRGPEEGEPEDQWKLKSPRELLDLRICDMAMGSGAFLVQACRYLSEKLEAAWTEAEAVAKGELLVTPEGDISEGRLSERPLPVDPEERLLMARRAVASRCLYGVDKNPMATEMAKLSLWLVTLQKDRPFTFVDHALRTGDSLLGITDPAQVRGFHVDPSKAKALHGDLPLFDHTHYLEPLLQRAVDKRKQLESFAVEDVRDSEHKTKLLAEAEQALADARIVCDLLVSAVKEAGGAGGNALDSVLHEMAQAVNAALKPGPQDVRDERLAGLKKRAEDGLGGGDHAWQPLHWLVEFPEVFLDADRRGFDAFVMNPPFQGGQKITGALGTDYREWLVQHLGGGVRGSADLCAYFFLRAYSLLNEGGGFGFIATNTIAQGDTREVGLDQLTAAGCHLPRAVASQKWPGVANLEVACVWARKGTWAGTHVLNDKPVSGISPYLGIPGKAVGATYRLAANAGKSFIGSYVLGLGFTMAPEEAAALIKKDPQNEEVLFPYLIGRDLNSSPTQAPSRWIINFGDWPLEKAETYPDCMAIVRELVKPDRDTNNRKVYRDRWWHYGEKRPALYKAIAGMDRVLVTARVSKHMMFTRLEPKCVMSEQLVVLAISGFGDVAVLQSSIHDRWAWEYASSMRRDLRYTPSDCLETFPFPHSTAELNSLGLRYSEQRAELQTIYEIGLTTAYNRFHDPDRGDLSPLRALHKEMDQAVAAAYGWTDLDLDHGFHQTKQGLRYTISESARVEVLDRLLELNHARYAQEVKEGLHPKAAAGKAKAKKKANTKKRAAKKKPTAKVKQDGFEF